MKFKRVRFSPLLVQFSGDFGEPPKVNQFGVSHVLGFEAHGLKVSGAIWLVLKSVSFCVFSASVCCSLVQGLIALAGIP